MSFLGNEVLPLIRTRADLHRWHAANAHGSQMHQGIDILEAARPSVDPVEVHKVTHAALASAIKVIARADDSSGIIGDACRRLLALHPRTAAAANPNIARLVDWMITFQFDGDVDFFEIDPVAYAPALAEKGMAGYRGRLQEVRDRIGLAPADGLADPCRHDRWTLEWNDQRLAVLDRDVEMIIRTHVRDRGVAARFQDTARALAEIEEFDLAIDWAHQALDIGPRHQSMAAAEYWCALLETHRPEHALDARLEVFRRWPSSGTGASLYRSAGDLRDGYRDEVMAALESHPRDAVVFALDTLKDAPLAWRLAHSLDLADGDIWDLVVKTYEKIDPVAVLPVHRRLVEQDLVEADARRYRSAARRLARMRTLAASTPEAQEVDTLIRDLREAHRRRPRLQQEFDRAHLP